LGLRHPQLKSILHVLLAVLARPLAAFELQPLLAGTPETVCLSNLAGHIYKTTMAFDDANHG
jgi:hypothetical protein